VGSGASPAPEREIERGGLYNPLGGALAGYNISHHVFSSASLTLLVVVIARRISDTVSARARTC